MQDRYETARNAIGYAANFGTGFLIGTAAMTMLRKARPLWKVVGLIGAGGVALASAEPVFVATVRFIDGIHDGIKDNVRIERVDDPEQKDGEA